MHLVRDTQHHAWTPGCPQHDCQALQRGRSAPALGLGCACQDETLPLQGRVPGSDGEQRLPPSEPLPLRLSGALKLFKTGHHGSLATRTTRGEGP